MEQRIQSYLRHAASRDRDLERIGPFLATFTRRSNNPFLNYAIPEEGAVPTSEESAALIAAFRRRERVPRLEYIPQLAPQVEPTLLAAGFQVEEHMPLMVCSSEQVQQPPLPDGIDLLVPTTDAEIYALIAAQNEAYGEGAPGADDVQRRRAFLKAGGIAVLARDRASGETVGGGQCEVPFDQMTELTSVGVRPAYRRRGIAAAITARLVLEAGSAAVFLMAAHEGEARIYARVGFQRIGEVLALILR